MNKKEKEILNNMIIETYWWNFRKKTKDFEGTATEYLKKNGIEIKTRRIKESDNYSYTVYSYTQNLGAKEIKVKHKGNYYVLIDIVKDIVSTALVHMGDKATLSISSNIGNRYFTNNFHR